VVVVQVPQVQLAMQVAVAMVAMEHRHQFLAQQ
jgi:hypothetical protein